MPQPNALQGTSRVKAVEKGRAGPVLQVGEYLLTLHRKGNVGSECPVPLNIQLKWHLRDTEKYGKKEKKADNTSLWTSPPVSSPQHPLFQPKCWRSTGRLHLQENAMNLANFPFSRMSLIALHATGFTITEDTSENYFWATINHFPTQSMQKTYWVRTTQWTKPVDKTADRVSMTNNN